MFSRSAFSASILGAAVTFLTPNARAFCGFYVSGADTKLFNNATQVVLMRDGTRTILSMQNNYEGPPENFAMVVPVPVILQKDNVKTLPASVFAKIDQLDSPRLVEYWEQDPCAPPVLYAPSALGGTPKRGTGAGGAEKKADLGVTIEAQFTVGEYEIVILSAKDAGGLDTWLREQKYSIPAGSDVLFRPYVQAGSKFFVARVDVSKVTFTEKAGKKMATLSPLRFYYDWDQFSLPVRLGLVNSGGTQDLVVHILAKNQRYEVANYPNATIPTNLDVSENARTSFGSFYASLFDRTVEKNPKAVITEYSWDAGTCDPCPGPALAGDDLATLGADVLNLHGKTSTPGRISWMPSGFVVTRLHARYSKESLGEDLVFRAAPPIVGGREVKTGPDLEHGATPSSVNNFQGRYAIRHPWGGPITCKEPRRNIWGGPPGSYGAKTEAPKDITFAARDVKLASFVRSDITELGIKEEGAPVTPISLPPAGTPPAGAAPTPVWPSDSNGPPMTPVPAPSSETGATRKGCAGCALTTHESPGFAGFGALIALVMMTGRRLLWPRRASSKSRESCRKSS